MRAGLLSLAATTASRAAKPARPSSAPKKSSPSSAKPSASPSSPKKSDSPPKKPPPPPRAKPNPLVNTVWSLSPALAKLIDVNEATRPDALKRVWVYIKAQKLQNQLDKKEVLCDEKLKALFGRDKVTINEVVKFLSPHILKKD